MEAIPAEATEALRDLALGRVQRSRHSLTVDGQNAEEAFRKILRESGYRPFTIRDLRLEAGVRCPAWVIREGAAYFGYVFQEKFSETRRRTIFGSVVRDRRGDWEVILTSRSSETVWVNLDRGAAFEEDKPAGGLG